MSKYKKYGDKRVKNFGTGSGRKPDWWYKEKGIENPYKKTKKQNVKPTAKKPTFTKVKAETQKPESTMENRVETETQKPETPMENVPENETQETETQESQIFENETPKTETQETETRESVSGQDDSADFFANLKTSYKEKEEVKTDTEIISNEAPEEKPKAEQPKAEPESKLLISGYMFLLAVNVIYPELLLGLFKMFSKKYKDIEGSDIALDDTQMGMMEEIADEFVRQYLPKMSPFALFFICLNGFMVQNLNAEVKKKRKDRISI